MKALSEGEMRKPEDEQIFRRSRQMQPHEVVSSGLQD